MNNYSYLILSPIGKEVKGTIQADSLEAATLQLKKEGNTVITVEEASVLSQEVNVSFLDKKPNNRDMAVFCRQITSILNAGVAVTVALGMLAEQTENKILAAALYDCKKQIEMGSSLADGMRQHPDCFNHMFVTLVAAGEASGSLEISFERMGTQFEKDAKLVNTIKKASTYPIMVLIIAVAVITVMLTYVVPQYEEMLASLDTELPMLTQVVVSLSHSLIDRWYVVVAVIIAAWVGLSAFGKTDAGQALMGQILFKAPLVGPLTVKSASARMARTLSTLIGAGLPMLQALDIVADTMSNVLFRNALMNVKDEVAMGEQLSKSVEATEMFPPLVHHMLGIGEETGDIEEMLDKVAEYYEEEVEITTQQIMTVIEPLIIVVLALIVGAVVGAVMLPMVSMYSALENV